MIHQSNPALCFQFQRNIPFPDLERTISLNVVPRHPFPDTHTFIYVRHCMEDNIAAYVSFRWRQDKERRNNRTVSCSSRIPLDCDCFARISVFRAYLPDSVSDFVLVVLTYPHVSDSRVASLQDNSIV